MSNRIFGVMAVAAILVAASSAVANPCTREGQQVCENGERKLCVRTGSELTPIFQDRNCVVETRTLNGTWRGVGHQTPAGATASDWTIVMTITNGGGSIQYPSLACGGVLAEISRTPTSATFRSTITYGRDTCGTEETITVNMVNGRLGWHSRTFANGQEFVAIAVLTR